MKKTMVLAVALFLVSSVSFAQGKAVIGLGGVVGIPMSTETADQVGVGFGGTGHIGYALDDLLTISLVSGYKTHSALVDKLRDQLELLFIAMDAPPEMLAMIDNMTISGSIDYVPILAELRCNFSSGQVKPYGFLGAGVALNSTSWKVSVEDVSVSASANEVAFLLSPGLGVAFAVSDKVDIFVQGGVDLDFTSNNNTATGTIIASYPGGSETMTGSTNITGDSPTIFIPFEVGVLFSL